MNVMGSVCFVRNLMGHYFFFLWSVALGLVWFPFEMLSFVSWANLLSSKKIKSLSIGNKVI